MKLPGLIFCLSFFLLSSASAQLKLGQPAPPFSAEASLGGKVYTYNLKTELAKGPVVLYFYPAAFTKGCTIEAHLFADATDDIQALGAGLIGVSNDTIDTLNKFSASECRSKFPVAADPEAKIIRAYDVALPLLKGMANRTSYLISPEGKVVFEYSSMSPASHVKKVLAALQKWRLSNPKK